MRDVLRCLILIMVACWPVAPAVAEDEPAPTPEEERAEPEPTVALIEGVDVNLRVGPRVDVRPVAQLAKGTVLLVVERVPGWVGVCVPSGFLAAVSGEHVRPVGADAVRVEPRRLNLRVAPAEAGKPLPGAFREQVTRGTVLPLIEREGAWVWVMAPETVRAYVSERFVRELGPLAAHKTLVDAARARRTAHLAGLAQIRRDRAARISGNRLREAFGKAQQALYKLRIGRGIDRTPVVEIIGVLEAEIEACRESPVGVRKLALALREDLEAELEIRMARKDAEVARLRGLDPPVVRPSAPKISKVELRGSIRWEAAPTWRNGGEWVLWIGEEPRYVLQLTTGLPHPLPDLKAHADGAAHTVEGSQSGRRVFGLPVVDVRALR